ncbi:hypothetical protein [Actinokineospora sp. NBRC 105648]|uniref:hypothetical protein n=1 Tax=Actinokineospora sp. NBRC 105648 TaxID=3032206 RepID=UPI0024A3CE07|nr:hypothetical protein [Actinokineospora sp. NBRC 105648]GLZ40995.1 hypothetical protein Acsp05_46190 [Actinokineospora sp. NBRC 105648]
MSGRTAVPARLLRLVLAAALIVAGVALVPEPSRAVAVPPTASATTVKGKGDFAALEVTVSQTRDLINQTIHLSWKGATPTDSTRSRNFLQVMQCWGDDPTGPRKDQCVYGSPLANYDSLALWSRQLLYQDYIQDKAETQPEEQVDSAGGGKRKVPTYVPFTPVSGPATKATEPGYGLYYDASLTNEVQVAATQQNGTGDIDFEVQTLAESPALECGKVRTSGPDTGKPRHCWLVVVPRGDRETNGKVVSPGLPDSYLHNYLDSSPLSESNWRNHISVRLDFQPVGEPCRLGVAERALSGHEFVSDAVLRWQPTLCAGTGPVFGFVQVPDRQARELLGAEDPGMVFLNNPADATTLPADRKVVYAPVAVSAYTVAFIMERQPATDAPADVLALNGQPMTELKLTPRLVAKLLTQSYSDAVPGAQDYLKGNPTRLSQDEDFLDLNPDFRTHGRLMQTVDALASSVDSDATGALWSWVLADQEAKQWLTGTPDGHGMKVNKKFLELSLQVDNFPKADLSCVDVKYPKIIAQLCSQTRRPLAADMHEAGRAVNRGDSLGREPNGLRDPNDLTRPGTQKVGRSVIGRRAQLAIVDTATAARYGLQVAKLRNAAGNFVAPTDDNVRAGLAEMTDTGVPGVKRTNPAAKGANAYPLASVTYAATVPSMLTKDAGKDYGTFLRYAVGPGQDTGEGVGKLPVGYVPLSQQMREQTTAAATAIERDSGIKPPVEPAPVEGTSGPAAEPPAAPADAAVNTGDTAPAAGPAPQPAPAAPESSAASSPAQNVAQARTTPSTPVGWLLRYLLAALLVVGGLATAGGPLLTQLGRRVSGR